MEATRLRPMVEATLLEREAAQDRPGQATLRSVVSSWLRLEIISRTDVERCLEMSVTHHSPAPACPNTLLLEKHFYNLDSGDGNYSINWKQRTVRMT